MLPTMQPDDFDINYDPEDQLNKHINPGSKTFTTIYGEEYKFWVGNIEFNSYDGSFHTSTLIVDFDGIFDYDAVNLHVHTKQKLCKEIRVAARTYWYKQFHREYRRTIAQWLQREIELPGEIAAAISDFA